MRLVSKAYRKSGTRGKREHQHSSIVPFVSVAGEVISVFYVLASKPGEKLVSVPHFKSLRDHTSYREYFLITPTGYTNNEVFPAMVAQFEEDFHRLYPGVRALVYLDRLGSHTTKQLLATIEGKMVSLVLFPAGTTQFLQPLDDAVFGLFKTKLRMHRDRLLTANPLRCLMAENALLTAMMLAIHESLTPAPIKASFLKTGIYPWNPEKILAAARLAYPDVDFVDPELPDPTQQVIAAIQAASPQDNKVVLSRFRRHQLDQGRIYTLEELKNETKPTRLRRLPKRLRSSGWRKLGPRLQPRDCATNSSNGKNEKLLVLPANAGMRSSRPLGLSASNNRNATTAQPAGRVARPGFGASTATIVAFVPHASGIPTPPPCSASTS